LSDSFPIQNVLNQGYSLSPLFFNFPIRKVKENQVELKLNGTHQLLAYADDWNLLGDNTNTINRNTETLIDASKEAGLEVNVEKTEYMLVSCDQNADHSQDTQIANRMSEHVTQLRYLGTSVTNNNLIQEIKKRLNSANACYHSICCRKM
jgi:hypothetical protein